MTQARDKRIALFLPSLRGGGAEGVMVALANAFASRGFTVDLVLVAYTGPHMKHVTAAVRIVDLAARRALAAFVPLLRYLRSSRPDVMLSTQTYTNLVAAAARAVAAPGMRLVVREASTPSVLAEVIGRRKEKAVLRLLPWGYRAVDAIIAPSVGVADDLRALLGSSVPPLVVIHNPVDAPAVRKLAAQEVVHRWFVPGADPVVVAVGRLSAPKDFPTLIRAFARVRAKRSARLLILGEGEERLALEQLVRSLDLDDCVEMPGFEENPFRYVARCAIYVLCSRFEGLPNTLLQAMALGVPVISTNCPSGPREILDDGRWGRLVAVGDDRALADAILTALDDPSPPMPAALFESRYGADHSVDKYLRVCNLAEGPAS